MPQEPPPLLPIIEQGRPSTSGVRASLKLWPWILLVAFLGLSFLTALVIFDTWTRVTEHRITAAHDQIQSLKSALEMFEVDSGNYPAMLQDLVRAPSMASNWYGPYIKGEIPHDPWGKEYVYQYPGAHTSGGVAFELRSLGLDKATNSLARHFQAHLSPSPRLQPPAPR